MQTDPKPTPVTGRESADSQDAFATRGFAALLAYQQNGHSYPAEQVIGELERMLDARRRQLGLAPSLRTTSRGRP